MKSFYFKSEVEILSLKYRCVFYCLLLCSWFSVSVLHAEENSVDGQVNASTGSTETCRTDIKISGVYPHLTTYGVYSQNGGHFKQGHNECGIGAIVPWAGKLWMVNYAPHMPHGSEHKLYSVDADLAQPMVVHPESVGGTPAGRMTHEESQQLFIGHHVVDKNGNVRTISPKDMPIRVTAVTRHLTKPAEMVHYVDMEGSIWEADVKTLKVKELFKKPVPGWHGKGAYKAQGRLVVSNNGEYKAGSYEPLLVGGPPQNDEERGVLAEWDGSEWRIIERRQYTEVTGPAGIRGGSEENIPIWSMGWDRRSVRLKVLEDGIWHTFLLPKASYCNDAIHGWYTEWPRIREITDDRWMMDMHGMFFNFPKNFTASQSAGITPIGSHLRYVPDFCDWNGQLVLASDETSIQGNHLAGQPQSNLWFGTYEGLQGWGPASGYGGPWVEDEVVAGQVSDPFLVAGFERRILHLAIGKKAQPELNALRASDQQVILEMPQALMQLARITVDRGDWHRPAAGFEFTVDQPTQVYLSVDRRGEPKLDPQWKKTDMSLRWGKNFIDDIYVREFASGKIVIPGNPTEHTPGSFGMPHLAFVDSFGNQQLQIDVNEEVKVTRPEPVKDVTESTTTAMVKFDLEVDRQGNGEWEKFDTVELADAEYKPYQFPNDFDAVWLRLKVDRDCIATAFLHQTAAHYTDGNTTENQELFSGLGSVHENDSLGGLLYAAKRNRNLRVINEQKQHFEFTKAEFAFESVDEDPELEQLLDVEPEFSVDAASVIVRYQGKNYRLPKTESAYDQPFSCGWPRAVREVESERNLTNIHGTFYELPLITNGAPPAWNLIRPVSSHSKRITDFCSWNGLLVLAGAKPASQGDGHVYASSQQDVALWFGGVDDLWRLGKPHGHGGPWLKSSVKAQEPSDPYLIAGYDRKSVSISHQSNESVDVTLEIDFLGTGSWWSYQTFKVPAGEVVEYEFPEAFSARWVRAKCSRETQATVQFEYQ